MDSSFTGLIASESGQSEQVAIEIAGSTLGKHRHICAFFRNAEEENRIMMPFIKDGLERGDRACQMVDPSLRDEHLRQLYAAGIDVAQQERDGQLEVLSVFDMYLRDGHFDLARMLDVIQQHISGDSKTPISRITGHAEWAGEDWPGVEDFLEYEARLNDVVPEGRDTVVCLYDLSKTSASLVADVLRTHPVIILGGVVHENPFFTPVEQFIAELRARKEAS
ncbi:MEDS domain-containing protein [Variovorax ginsengisoli]|uniref:MEDS domain-containing protein n=1 Tax=Variovorax ginsengisoli TaxID=363844 RepID=A0ABT8SER4_9BURK|nr:MEDS domain-containing protein [Variovorax ginsengisoli]MDN8618070.1 MEDS domain-containing protein [Variovorax ginsengisoli]MDO1537240.1 MEDS domain-containing protein [Variovorax ginsengisoli]